MLTVSSHRVRIQDSVAKALAVFVDSRTWHLLEEFRRNEHDGRNTAKPGCEQVNGAPGCKKGSCPSLTVCSWMG